MKRKIFFILPLIAFAFADTYTGYLNQVEASFCMDECSQYALETETGQFIDYIYNIDDTNLEYYINRFVTIETSGNYDCLMCSALILDSIELSENCDYPISCFADPCEVADECLLNTPVECISNFCGGCYADFYDLEGNLVDCDMQGINPCDDLVGVDFGMCDMYLGVAVVNGQCQHLSGCGWNSNGIDYSEAFFSTIPDCEQNCLDEPYVCEDIEYDYSQLHSGYYAQCEDNSDCIAVWGDCGVGLGGCHYAVNEYLYNQEEVTNLVSIWLDNDCMEWVCDCASLPNTMCNNGLCELAYCYDENPEGCFASGCDENYSCLDYEETGDCVPSSCFCDEFYGDWFCTEDCNGGTCYLNGDIDFNGNIDVIDVVMVINMILGLSDISILSDFNGDNITNVIDVILMVNIILE